MAIQVRRVGDDLLVDNLDLKRAARSLLKQTRAADWTPPGDMNQAMELIARLAGFSDLHAAVAQASRASTEDLGSLHQQRPQFAAHSLADTLPEGLPPKFTKGKTVAAIVGRPGFGKPVSAKVMAHSMNGAVQDYLSNLLERRDASGSRRIVGAAALDLDLMRTRCIEALPSTTLPIAAPTPAEQHSAPGASGTEPARRIRNRP